jgi:hypothetical protein
MASDCEWNPTAGRAALSGDPSHGEAIVCVGAKGLWHLCATCAALPRFNIYRTRKPLPRRGLSDAEPGGANGGKL